VSDNVQFQSNIVATPSSDVTVATDDIDGISYQRFKLAIGGDGKFIGDVSPQYPLHVATDVGDAILKQLKIMNMHLSILTDINIQERDI
jgi:hypothetical protein